MGRRTTIIHFGQNTTRVSIVAFLLLWSLILPWIWDTNSLWVKLYTLLGMFLSARIFILRQKTSDERSFRIYNVSTMY